MADYVAALEAQLPAPVVRELAAGLDETRDRYVGEGLDAEAAARAAMAEFGRPAEIVAAFLQVSPVRRAARRLLVTGPLVGLCWVAVLVSDRSWTWPVPALMPAAPGVVLASTIALLIVASFGTRYRAVRRAGAAALAGVALLDASLIVSALLAGPATAWWLVAVAAVASAARAGFSARTLGRVRAA